MDSALLPKARTRDLLEEEIAQETLLYDTERHRALLLNGSAIYLWKLCDGRTTVAQAARLMAQDLGLPEDESVVYQALGELKKFNLLEEPLPLGMAPVSRRELVKRFGLAAAVALPLISAVVAPLPVAAASGVTGASGAPGIS